MRVRELAIAAIDLVVEPGSLVVAEGRIALGHDQLHYLVDSDRVLMPDATIPVDGSGLLLDAALALPRNKWIRAEGRWDDEGFLRVESLEAMPQRRSQDERLSYYPPPRPRPSLHDVLAVTRGVDGAARVLVSANSPSVADWMAAKVVISRWSDEILTRAERYLENVPQLIGIGRMPDEDGDLLLLARFTHLTREVAQAIDGMPPHGVRFATLMYPNHGRLQRSFGSAPVPES